MSDLADLHRAAFGADGAHGWSPAALRAALDDPSLIVVVHADAYAIARPILDEAELLLIGTRAQARRNGAATAALAALETSLQARGVAKIILEVAARNAPARAFYARHGFRQAGIRQGYYRTEDGTDDAVLLERDLGSAP